MEQVTLQVSEACMEDVGKSRVRLCSNTRLELQLTVGDVVSISHGNLITAAIVWRAHPDDEGRKLIRMDGLIRDNVKVKIGNEVVIRKADVNPAKKVVLIFSVEKTPDFGSGINGVIKRGLFKRPVTKGDVLIVPGIYLIGRALPFSVVETEPQGIVQIEENTDVEILDVSTNKYTITSSEDDRKKEMSELINSTVDNLERLKKLI